MMERLGLTKKGVVSISVILLFGCLLFVLAGFRTTHIEYEGNTRYTDEEMTNYIFGGKYNVNTLVYSFFTSKKDKVVIPFIQDYEVTVDWPNKLNVQVYEKSIIGYIRYMGYNMYFDKDGIVVDSSPDVLEGVPRVDGMPYRNIVLHSKLEVENEEIFDILLELVQMCNKYSITVDRVFFDQNLNVTMYMGNVKIILGDASTITEKIYEVSQMIPQMQGLSGTLHMENFSEDTSSIIFKKDN
ncbi:MAG: cell division protein FtsQ/DivIB [Lachnospiraceae bacterium]